MHLLQNCNYYKLIMSTIISAQVYLSEHRIKPSVQRIAIMDYLIENRIHPTADDVYNALGNDIPTLSRTTVYNTLKLFAEQGVLQIIGIDDTNARFDVDISDHAHFKCLNCGYVCDMMIEIPDSVRPAKWNDLMIKETHLYYKGYCEKCSKTKKL